MTIPDLPGLDQPGQLMQRLGIALSEASIERVVGTMRVDGNTQPAGLLHGGASVALAETLGSVGSMIHGGPGRVPVGVDISATHHRGVRSGIVTGTATPLHLGQTVTTWAIEIRDDGDRLVCTARLTCLLRDLGR